MTSLKNVLQEIQEMKYPIEGIGCGLEDVGITDRYEAAEYGWNEAVDMVFDLVQNYLSDMDNNGWIPVEDGLPEDDNYILLSFENYTLPAIGRYEADSEGGAFYVGDNDKPCINYGLFVNAWRPLPEPHNLEKEEVKYDEK